MDTQSMSLEELNGTLEERLQIVKSHDFRRINAAREEINRILYSAIKEHPLTINAVVINAMPDMNRECSDLPNGGNRNTLRAYLKAVGNQDLEGLAAVEFVEHLPFSLGRYLGGDWYRPARSSEYRNLELVAFESKLLVPFGLRLDISGGFYNDPNDPTNVYFLMEEIQGIRLAKVEDTRFSQKFGTIYRESLYPSHTALEHYLIYKTFSPLMSPPAQVDGDKLWLPSCESTLALRTDYGHPRHLSGFAVQITTNGPVLYELNNVMQDHIVEEVAASQIIAVHQERPLQGVKTYAGNQIIARLRQTK